MGSMPPASRPIRVMQVIARMNVGGPAVMLCNLADDLDPAEFEVSIITGIVDAGEADYLSTYRPRVPVTVVPGLGRSVRLLGDLRALVTLTREMRRRRPDVVHTHTAKAGVLGRLAAILARVPVRVHTFHGHVLHGYFGRWATAGIVAVERVLARFTTVLVAVGEQVRDDLLAAGIGRPEQYVVIPPGVTVTEPIDGAEARRRLELPAAVPVVAFIGRLTSIKRPDRLIDAWRRVHAEVPDAILLVVGEGDLASATRASAGNLGAAVRFLGWREHLAEIYAAADLVVLTSDNEGMPVTLIEAAMAGVPVVSTSVGSAKEVVSDGNTGVVVPADPAAIANSITALLQDPVRRERLGAAAAAWARSRFSRPVMAARHASIYRPHIGNI